MAPNQIQIPINLAPSNVVLVIIIQTKTKMTNPPMPPQSLRSPLLLSLPLPALCPRVVLTVTITLP